MDVGALVVLIILPLSISVVAQLVLRRADERITGKSLSDEAGTSPARVLGTAGLGLLVKPKEPPGTAVRGRPGPARSALDALATVGGVPASQAPP